jgi:hypothetical protein
MEQAQSSKNIAVIIAEIKSTSRELYPLTKNYPMALLSVGPKRLIVYQLEALLAVPNLESTLFPTKKSSLSAVSSSNSCNSLSRHNLWVCTVTTRTG